MKKNLSKIHCEYCNGTGSKYVRLCGLCYGTGYSNKVIRWLKFHLYIKRKFSNSVMWDFRYPEWNTFLNPPKIWTCETCNGFGWLHYGEDCPDCETGLKPEWDWMHSVFRFRDSVKEFVCKIFCRKPKGIWDDSDIPF